MTTRTSRLRDLFHAALELPATERTAFAATLPEPDRPLAPDLLELLEQVDELGLDEDLALPDEPCRPPPAAARPDALGRYTIVRELGRGAMGVVYEARQQPLDRPVALKVVRRRDGDPGDPGPAAWRRVQRRSLDEAATLARLDHPGIVPIHDLEHDEDGVSFTMRLVEGEDSLRIIERVHAGDPDWTQQRALDVLLKVCDALAFAHDRGVLHRDLKPGHVLVGSFGETYVVDWGLAKVNGRPESPDLRLRDAPRDAPGLPGEAARDALVTMDGDILGTPAYMAPEQARGELSRMGAPSDVYSVGAMLYHLLAGRAPYAQAATRGGGARAVLLAVVAGPPPAVDAVARGVPPELAAICGKAMAREPADRYASMAELAADLRAFLEQRVVQAYRTGPVAEFRKWCQRNRALAAAAAALLFVVLAGCATVAASESRRRQEVQARLDELLRLSDVAILQQLQQIAGGLQADAEQIPTLEAWLAEAGELIGRLPVHRASLEAMRRQSHQQKDLSGSKARLAELLRATRGDEVVPTFGTADEQWHHDTLARLVDDLQQFAGPQGTFDEVRSKLGFARDLAAGDVDLVAALALMDAGRAGPLHELVAGADFARHFERKAPEVLLDGPKALAGADVLRDGSTLVFPAGVFRLPDVLARQQRVPADLTLAGAGMDETLLVVGNLDTRHLLERFGLRDCTIFTDNDYLFDLRVAPAIVWMERVRVTGFDMGAGSSCVFGTEELALLARECEFVGGFGRHPQHGTLFDVRTGGLLARFSSCRLALLDLDLPRLLPRATVRFQACEISDLLGTAWSDPAAPPPGVTFADTSIAAFPGRDELAPRRELDELFPGWREALRDLR